VDKPVLTITNDAVRLVWRNWPPRRMGWIKRLACQLLLDVKVTNRTLQDLEIDRLIDVNAHLAAENDALQQLAEAAQADLARYVRGDVDACLICKHFRVPGTAMPCIACRSRDAFEWGKALSMTTKEEGGR